MLNSAAGVMLPSPIAPPMSTIRAGRTPRARASATFVSGPTRPAARLRRHVLGEELDRVLRDRLGRPLGQRRPVETALAVDVRGDVRLAHERPLRTHGDGNVHPAGEARARATRCPWSSRASGCRASS